MALAERDVRLALGIVESAASTQNGAPFGSDLLDALLEAAPAECVDYFEWPFHEEPTFRMSRGFEVWRGHDEIAEVMGVACPTYPLRRDGLEIFFFSTRPGTLGMADIYSATRASASDPWGAPVNLGSKVNSARGAETRPSLSWDGTTLYFGSTRPGGEGMADHYMTTREP